MRELPPPYKRYYLHRRIKEFYQVNARQREVIIPQAEAENITLHKAYKWIMKLQQYGYNIQITIN